MNCVDVFQEKQLFIDFNEPILFDSEEDHIFYPKRFPTVEFRLVPTSELIELADQIRMAEGHENPHLEEEMLLCPTCRKTQYVFTIGLNGFSEPEADGFILVEVTSACCSVPDLFAIELTEEEQLTVLDRLDEQCRKYLGKSCEELLAEAEKEMREDE